MARDHRDALEYDLITKAGCTLDDIGGALSWRSLFSFIGHLTPDSAIHREINPEAASWLSGQRTAGILADIYDLVALAHSDKWSHKPKPYPRPSAKQRLKHFGADPIPIGDFDRWWNERR